MDTAPTPNPVVQADDIMLAARDPAAIPPDPNPIPATTTGAAKTAATPPTMAAGIANLENLAPWRLERPLALPLGALFGVSASFFSPSLVSSAGSEETSFVF